MIRANAETAEKAKNLNAIINPIPSHRYRVDVGLNFVEKWLDGMEKDWGMNLAPDFQRGHVWTREQQTRFIEGIFRGTVTHGLLEIKFNAPHWNNHNYAGDLLKEMQIVDGLQRLTAVRAFLAGDVAPFGLTSTDLEGSAYAIDRLGFRLSVSVYEIQSKAELLQFYLDLNSGGTPHSAEELTRVQAMLEGFQP